VWVGWILGENGRKEKVAIRIKMVGDREDFRFKFSFAFAYLHLVVALRAWLVGCCIPFFLAKIQSNKIHLVFLQDQSNWM